MSGSVRCLNQTRARAGVAATRPDQTGVIAVAGLMMGLLALWVLLVTI
jgi:hypothetical protein